MLRLRHLADELNSERLARAPGAAGTMRLAHGSCTAWPREALRRVAVRSLRCDSDGTRAECAAA
jgi:hypothetical protein